MELADRLWESDGAALDPAFADDWRTAADDRAARRVVVDQVASLTDQTALSWYERLCAPADEGSLGEELLAAEGPRRALS
jgi:dGTPase